MEKVLYALWIDDAKAGDSLRDALLADFVRACLALPQVWGLRVAVADSAVEPASDKCQANNGPLPAALVSVWLDDGWFRDAIEVLLPREVTRLRAWLVSEAEPIVNTTCPPAADGRVPGFCQVAMLQRPPRLDRDTWLDIWKGSHGQVAIDTQSTFGYRQNLIVHDLGGAEGPELHAIVEENFPPEAMTSHHAFYAASDDATLEANVQTMMDSCKRFIDLDRIDVAVMSEYCFLPRRAH